MRFSRITAGLGLALLMGTPVVSADDVFKKPADTCSNHGTSINFYDSPSEAARRALKEEKLVFVLHVSGNFEDPRYT